MAKLYFYYSAMNAGKTTLLLQSSYNYQERGMATLLFTPSFDDRYEIGQITSRIGLKSPAIVFDAQFDLFQHTQQWLQQHPQEKLACVLVDEAHFLLKHQVKQLISIVDHLHLPVLSYGLRSDFQGEPFEGSRYLLGLADELSELKTICHCGRKATMNMRVDSAGRMVRTGEQVEIGGNERYVSTCRVHFEAGDSGWSKRPEVVSVAPISAESAEMCG